MQTESNEQEHRSRISLKKVIVWMIIFILLFLLIPFFAIPIYLSSDSGKNMILSKVNKAVDGNLKIDTLSMGWFAGIKVGLLDYSDNAGCTKVTAKEVSARPRYLSLLAGRVAIDEAVIDQPRVSVDISGQCAEIKEQEEKEKEKKEDKQPSDALMAISNIDLKVKDGDVKITAPDAANIVRTVELKNINSTLAIRPLGKESSFDVSLAVASENEISQINSMGIVKTSDEWSFAETSGQIKLDVTDLDLSTLGPLFKIMDVNMAASGRVNAAIDATVQKGQFENLQGKVNANDINVSGDFLKGDRIQTSKLQSDVKLNTTVKSVNIDSFNIETDGLTANAKGTVPKTMRSWEDFLAADSADSLQAEFDCDVAKTFKQIKSIAGFKEDFDINYGRLSGNIDTQAKEGQRTLTGKVKLWALEGKFPIKKIVLSKPVELDARITSLQNKIMVEKLALDSAFAKANISGSTDNMNYQAQLDLAKMQSDVGQFIDIKPQLSGDANLAGKAAFSKGILSSTGTGNMTNVVVVFPDGKEISEPSSSVKYDFTSDFNIKQLTIRSADITAAPGKINLRDSMIPLSEQPNGQTKINADMAIDLAKSLNYLRTFTTFDPQAQMSGTAQGDISLAIKDKVIDAATRQIAVKNFALTYPGQKPFTQEFMNLAFNGRFDTANSIYNIEKLSLTSPQIKLTGNLTNAQTGQNIKTEGNIKADYNLAAVSSMISPFLPAGLSAQGTRSDTFWFSSTYPKQQPALLKSNLNAKATFGFDSAEYMGLNLGKTDFNVNINKGLMSIAPFTTTVNQGKLNYAADANFRGTPSMMRMPKPMKILDSIQIDRETTDTLLKHVNPLFANALNVSGTLNFDCEKMAFPLESGYQNDIGMIGTLAINDMRLGGSSLLGQLIQLTGSSSNPLITVQPTRFVLENGILSYDDMQMNLDDKAINFSGRIGLDKTMKMTVTLPWERNNQRVKLPLKGTVDKPEIDMGALLQDQFQQEIQKQLEKGLKDIFK
ncbi:MAG: hypothetical protein A2Y10_15795 [Planctomycetes bacterium GWF2_41_51]|nr:MAG: hypothetical protein A2Y10_15795 [Planctomycetes bacterium GWF2_41_51]HBG27605.1 hypothetical protein [Phycisphaerales bacterium]